LIKGCPETHRNKTGQNPSYNDKNIINVQVFLLIKHFKKNQSNQQPDKEEEDHKLVPYELVDAQCPIMA
jgi:hypothetical protein